MGPFFGGFQHSHVVLLHGCGSRVEDSIQFDVTSEPLVNGLTWYVLSYLLRGRCEKLNALHGGAVLEP